MDRPSFPKPWLYPKLNKIKTASKNAEFAMPRLKSWESPRKEGRNHKGRGGSARARQKRKQFQTLRKKLKPSDLIRRVFSDLSPRPYSIGYTYIRIVL